MLKIFGRKLYIKARNDTDEELKIKGTPVQALVTNVAKIKGKYIVYCSPEEGEDYDSKLFKSNPLTSCPKVRIGGEVTVYVDEIDCDGQYFVDVPL